MFCIFYCLSQIVDISYESSSWLEYLDYIDTLIITGLKQTLLQSLTTLSTRVQRYEQVHILYMLVNTKIFNLFVCFSIGWYNPSVSGCGYCPSRKRSCIWASVVFNIFSSVCTWSYQTIIRRDIISYPNIAETNTF